MSGQCIDQGHERTIDGGGARSAVRFQDVAVDPEGALAQAIQPNDGA